MHPVLGKPTAQLLADLVASPTFRSTVHRVFPLSRSRVHPYSRALSSSLPAPSPAAAAAATRTKKSLKKKDDDLPHKTLIMSILNVTPDSFSDGDAARATDTKVALAQVKEHVELGADIVDIGGMSTRPFADDITSSEERARVVPVVQALRAASSRNVNETVISIDTFRPSVARAAIEAGADVINDVYGGREPGMLETMADLACPVILMHSRGTPSTMTSLTDYSADGGLVEGVGREMVEMVEKALAARVRRWNIILDPGFGFAKTGQQNLVLLRSLDKLFSASNSDSDSDSDSDSGHGTTLNEYPVLIGLSRKKFLAPDKTVAKERRLETAAAVACAIASGRCEIARVHDTADGRDVAAFGDRLLNSKE